MIRRNQRIWAAVAVVSLSISGEVRAVSWTQTAAGSFAWNSNSNWTAAFPNSAGAVANLNVGLVGNQTVSLNQAIQIGELDVGDTGGTAGTRTTISSGSGGNPLTFQSASPGGATAINFALSAAPSSGAGLALPAINVGTNSPLTINMTQSPTTTSAYVTTGNLSIGSNTVTMTGAPFTNIETVPTVTGVQWQLGGLTGSGNYIQNGGGTDIESASAFTGSITVNNGVFDLYGSGSLHSASAYILAGAWNETFVSPNDNKYPIGGLFKIGNPGSPVYTSIQPSRLNTNAPMIFKGGFLEYLGQALTTNFIGTNVVEQVGQMQFANGMSEIRLQDGNLQPGQGSEGTLYVSNSTTLLVNNPTNACVRQQGATVMVGGDDNTSRDGTFPNAMGVTEKLIFASGMSQFLKGAGGADGTMSKSIIPWMTDGTIYHPGQGLFMTYDNTNGLRCLTANEYYDIPDTGTVLGVNSTYNVSTTSVNASSSILSLGTNQTQTINSLQDQARSNSDLGAGATLNITSGAIEFNGPGKIGADRATAGTINFGSAEGVVWSDQDCEYGDTAFGNNVIGSTIAGSGGLTIAGKNRLLLTGPNTYTGKTSVGSGILQIGDGTLTDSKLGKGDLEVAAGATVTIAAHIANGISDSAVVSLEDNGDEFFGMINLSTGVNETVGRLILNGVVQPTGTYGSTSSAAANKLNKYFAGAGILTSTPDNLTWDNHLSSTGNGSTWDQTTNGTSQNWNNVGTAEPFYSGDNVTFNDSNNGHYNVTLASVVSPLSTVVNNSSGNYVISGSGGIGGSGGLTKSGASSLMLSTVDTYTGPTHITGGSLIIAAVGAIPTSSALTIDSTGTVVVNRNGGPRITLDLSSLTNNGLIDLKNNGMIIHNGSAAIAQTTLAAVFTQLHNGFGNGGWTGTKGIVSSTAADVAIDSVGEVLNGTDVTVKFTYAGDANLNGTVDGSDYSLIDTGFGSHGSMTGWQNGDFNYDGHVDGSDYSLIDNTFNQQSGSLAAVEIAGAVSTSMREMLASNSDVTAAVPEPASLGLVVLGACSMLNARRRRWTRSRGSV